MCGGGGYFYDVSEEDGENLRVFKRMDKNKGIIILSESFHLKN